MYILDRLLSPAYFARLAVICLHICISIRDRLLSLAALAILLTIYATVQYLLYTFDRLLSATHCIYKLLLFYFSVNLI